MRSSRSSCRGLRPSLARQYRNRKRQSRRRKCRRTGSSAPACRSTCRRFPSAPAIACDIIAVSWPRTLFGIQVMSSLPPALFLDLGRRLLGRGSPSDGLRAAPCRICRRIGGMGRPVQDRRRSERAGSGERSARQERAARLHRHLLSPSLLDGYSIGTVPIRCPELSVWWYFNLKSSAAGFERLALATKQYAVVQSSRNRDHGPEPPGSSALAHSEGTGSRLSLARMASAGLVQRNGFADHCAR